MHKPSHREVGLDARGLPVLEADGGVDGDALLIAVERRDDPAVALLHEGAPHLAGAGQLLVVGVQLLVEQHELADARGARQRLVDPVDLLLQQVVDLRLGREIGVGGVRDLLLLGPLPDHRRVDAEERRQVGTVLAHDHGFLHF